MSDDAGMVGDVGYFGPLSGELNVASESGEALGSGLLDLCCRNNDLCNAELNQVTLCQCGAPLEEQQLHGHYICIHCKTITSGCCGD